MRVTLLGCGGSGGVPLASGEAGGSWGQCDPSNPKNRRRRVSLWVECDDRSLIIDTSPDLREQIIDNGIARVDLVLFTHAHADHCHGLDEVRGLRYRRGSPIPAYMDAKTHKDLTSKFDYAFTSSHTQSKLYPALYEDRIFDWGRFEAEGLEITAFRQRHGDIDSAGFRIGNFAYSTDVVELDETAFAALEGLDLWVVDALRWEPHATHAHFAMTLSWIERVKPKRAILTHLNHMMDYQEVLASCPEGVEPGYDGLTVELS